MNDASLMEVDDWSGGFVVVVVVVIVIGVKRNK